jgi:hypothetical protein
LTENDLPDGLSDQELWKACLDLVLDMNRGWGVTTGTMEKVRHSLNNVFVFGNSAKDPLKAPKIQPKTSFYRFLAKIVGEKRLKAFVDRNSDLYRPRWLRSDVLDDRD